MKTALFCLLFAVVSQCAIATENSTEPMVYRYWDWSITQSRDDYQVAALTLALEKTLASHGPYQIIRVRGSYDGTRVVREIQTGKHLNIQAAPARTRNDMLTEVTEDTSIAVKVPLMNGLLGYRQLIVRLHDVEKFRQISDESQLKALIVGQGANWEDVDVYRHNGYTVNDAGNYLTLTNMLHGKRFDYLAMSIVETESMRASAEHSEQLAVVDNLVLYYPLPLYFYVSKQHPELATRLEQGLQIAQRDGALDALLQAHFAEQLAFLKQPGVKVWVLENPAIPNSMGLQKPKFTFQ